MNIATALISSIIREQDIETWGSLRLEYLPKEFHSIFRAVSKHFDSENSLPTFDDLKLSIPSREVQEKIAALESTDVDSEPYLLLEYLKNEYAQDMILSEVDTYLDRSVAMSRAEENVEALENIVIKVKDNIDLEIDSVSMQKIELFQTEEDLKKLFPKKTWSKLHLQIIYYGREFCKARECYGLTCKICTTCYPNRKNPVKIKKA